MYEDMKYKVVDNIGPGEDGEDINMIRGEVFSRDTYIWVHFGHGLNGTISLTGNGSGSYQSYGSQDFLVGPSTHRLKEVLLYSCEAAKDAKGWLNLVAKGGNLYATDQIIYQGEVTMNLLKKGDPYYPLHKTVKQ